MLTGSHGRRRERTEEQRRAWNQYQSDYRKHNPERVKRWHDNYVIRKAQRLLAEQAQASGGGDLAGA